MLASQAPTAPATMLPSPLAFDHVVTQLKLNGSLYYLDATRAGPVGVLFQMGVVSEGAQTLIATANTTALATMHWPNAQELSALEWTDALNLKRLGGDGELLVTRSWRGSNAASVRLSMLGLTQDQWRKYVLSSYERRYPGITLQGDPAQTV